MTEPKPRRKTIDVKVPNPVTMVPVPPVATPAQEVETTVRTQGRRRINLIWEITQAIIALVSVFGGVFIMVYQTLKGAVVTDLPTTLSSMIFLVLGFYFARTNHEKIGGVGPEGPNKEQGR